MELLVWGSVPIKNWCLLDVFENFDEETDLLRGIPWAARFPTDAAMSMSQRHKKNTVLVDDVANFSRLKVCSLRLVEFLRKKELPNVEYLPITILDHKGKPASKEYCIVHPIHLQDALDLKASQPEYNLLDSEMISRVARAVVDVTRLTPGVRLFRLKGLFHPVLIDKALAEEIQAAGFKGSTFDPLDEYQG